MSSEEKLLTTPQDIAAALGSEWVAEEKTHAISTIPWSILTNTERGYRIKITAVWNAPDRYEIGTYLPNDLSPFRDRTHDGFITVRATRSAEAIARDIQRRLLDRVVAGYESARKRLARAVAIANAVRANVKRLQDASDLTLQDVGDREPYPARIRLWHWNLTIDVAATNVDIKVCNVPVETAEIILRILAAGEGEE